MKRGCQRVKLGPNSKRSHEKNTGQKKEGGQYAKFRVFHIL